MIRPATLADSAAVAAIVAAAYARYIPRMGREPGPMRDEHARLIRDGRVHVLDQDGRVGGLVVLVPEPGAMLLHNVAISPDLQGRGLGRVLLAFAEDAARRAGLRVLRLYTHETMTENIALYGRFGFVETHRAEEEGLRRVFMSKPLS